MIDWKHPELAVETARMLRERGLRFHMDIIGDGELRPMAERLAGEYGLEGCVSFPGYQPPEEVRRQYFEAYEAMLRAEERMKKLLLEGGYVSE